MTDKRYLLTEERAIFELGELYSGYGYSRFKMSRFEQYDLYVKNKEFLVSDRMITFTDINGTLMALKPDVTISIIKNAIASEGGVRKVYYNENVYRASKKDTSFREIPQAGLECLGELDNCCICEVIALAVKSLQRIAPEYMLDISHMALLSGIMEAAGIPAESYPDAIECIREKNTAGLLALALGDRAIAQVLTTVHGEMGAVLAKIDAIAAKNSLSDEAEAALGQLHEICGALEHCGLADRVQIDFSVVNDMAYYNGIVFQGFVRGVPESVLSGGQYDRLVQKMGRSSGAIGFAVYLDKLSALDIGGGETDADVLLIYGADTSPARLLAAQEKITAGGQSVLVRAENACGGELGGKYGKIINITDWEKENG